MSQRSEPPGPIDMRQQGDNDTELFWTYVVIAMGRAVDDVGGAALDN
jgi:hypothetical protein